MTETPQADALLTALISGNPQIEAFADLTDEHEREKALHILLALLTDPSDVLRLRAVQALSAMRDRRAVEPLIISLDVEESDFDMGSAVFEAKFDALLAFGDPEAIMPLLTHYRYEDWDMDKRDKIYQFNTENLLHVLGDATNSPDTSVRKSAVAALGSINDPRSIQFLLKALNDERVDNRWSVVYWLMKMQAVEAVPFLLLHTADPDVVMRIITTEALGELGDPQAVPALLSLLDDQDRYIQIRAAIALGKLGDPAGLDLISEYIMTADLPYFWNYLDDMLKALKTLRVFCVPILIMLVTKLPHEIDDRVETVLLIAEIFAEQGDPAALPSLNILLSSIQDEAARAIVQQAIDAIKARVEDCDD